MKGADSKSAAYSSDMTKSTYLFRRGNTPTNKQKPSTAQ